MDPLASLVKEFIPTFNQGFIGCLGLFLVYLILWPLTCGPLAASLLNSTPATQYSLVKTRSINLRI